MMWRRVSSPRIFTETLTCISGDVTIHGNAFQAQLTVAIFTCQTDLLKSFRMGRKRVKKSCTSCGFSHNESETRCEVPKTVEEELSGEQDVQSGAVGGEPPLEPMSTQVASDQASRDRMPDQSARNELASLENRMNSRMEKFEAVIVNLVSGLSLPGQATVSAEKKPTVATTTTEAKPAKSEKRRSWGGSDSSDSDVDTETSASKEKKKQKRRFRHKNFLQWGESVNDIDSLMMVTFRTMLELQEEGEDLSGLLQHGLLLAEKSSKGVYKFDALLSYDEVVRKRAGREGVSEFKNVRQEEVMKHFCFDNSVVTELKKPSKTKSKRAEKVCLRYNGDDGCTMKNCFYAHKCLACDDPGHAKRDCKNIKKKPADK